MDLQKKAKELASQNYPVLLHRDADGDLIAEVPDLPGCISDGKTPEEALAGIEEAKIVWVEMALEKGLDVPPPRDLENQPSGRFLARLPKSLHRALQVEAEREGVSLNQCVIFLLTRALATRSIEVAASKATAAIDTAAIRLHDATRFQRAFQVSEQVSSYWDDPNPLLLGCSVQTRTAPLRMFRQMSRERWSPVTIDADDFPQLFVPCTERQGK